MRILIADDDAVPRTVIEFLVAQLGHEFISAADGNEAWDRFQSAAVDVVISDRSMPGIGGLELCRRIRSTARDNKYTYFIFVTSSSGKGDILDGIKAGADDYLVKPLDADELATRLIVAERINALHNRLATQQTRLELLNAQLFDQANTDSLTRMNNRLKLRDDLARLPNQASDATGPFCALMVDIDYFKSYNDTYGHFAGDKVLTCVAETLLANLRQNDRGYRFGGEEFLLLLTNTLLRDGCLTAERCRAAIQSHGIPHKSSSSGILSISIGVAQWPCGDMTVNAWLKETDNALYQAKYLGRNRVYPGPEDQR